MLLYLDHPNPIEGAIRDSMGQWADVYVESPSDRMVLGQRALFFIPTALARCQQAGLSVGFLGSLSQTAPISEHKAGRIAIRKVMHFEPVTYASAVGFIQVANYALAERAHPLLDLCDIVACAFRLEDLIGVMADLSVTPEHLARYCKLNEEVVAAALSKYRLQFADADVIWRFLHFVRWLNGAGSARLDARLDGEMTSFIKTDDRPPLAVRRVGDDEFAYGWRDLRPAPRTGHPWAIDAGS